MARFYSDENIALQIVNELRSLGHDVLTSFDAGNANAAVPDESVLAFASAEGRILLSNNRRHFVRLHRTHPVEHSGIVLCTFDPDFPGQAQRIHAAVTNVPGMKGELIRVNRPA